MTRALAAFAAVFARPCLLTLVVVAYFVFLAGLRLALFPGTSEDDAEQLFYAQAFAWGYKDNQPPLYTWLVMAAERLTGSALAAATIVKFASLIGLYVFFVAAARRMLRDPLAAGVAGATPVALYYVGWDSVLNYSHSVLMMALLALTLLLIARLGEHGRILDYLLLGAVCGLGLLAKYNFALFLAGVLAGSLAHPVLRARMFGWPMVLTFVVAALIVAPHAAWLIDHPPPGPDRGAAPIGIAGALMSAVAAAAAFLLPLLVLLIAFFPRAFTRLRSVAETNHWRRFFEVYFVAVAVIVALGLLVRPAEVRIHWLAILLPLPVYLLLRAEAADIRPMRVTVFAAVLASVALAVPIGMGAVAAIAPGKCRKCNLQIPYVELAQELRAQGFSRGAVVALDYPNQLAGNLRRYFPETRFVSLRYRRFVPPAGATPGQCLLMWPTAIEQPGLDTRQSVASFAQEVLGTRPPRPEQWPTRRFDVRISDRRTIQVAYVLFADAACR